VGCAATARISRESLRPSPCNGAANDPWRKCEGFEDGGASKSPLRVPIVSASEAGARHAQRLLCLAAASLVGPRVTPSSMCDIPALFTRVRQRCGSPRIHDDLREAGVPVQSQVRGAPDAPGGPAGPAAQAVPRDDHERARSADPATSRRCLSPGPGHWNESSSRPPPTARREVTVGGCARMARPPQAGAGVAGADAR
jgi:hypothetical protein